ncbi:MAG: hypothetical protein IJ679_02570 [Lachnospiraceae bacterium]|nr:hypothetical protein [Lachnospiraceae bacterium]
MGTVYLHIGVPKTGTTSVQRFLMKNREILEQKGYTYPDFGFLYPGVGPARNAYFVAQTGKENFQDEWADSFRQLERLGKTWDHIILSDEAVWNRQKPPGFWSKVRQKFDEIGLKFHVICYLRRQDTLVESFWNQRVKGKGKMTMPFEEFLIEKYKFMPMAYDEWLDRIVEEGKPDELTIKVFERGQLLGGSVVDDFCDVIGMPVTTEFAMPKDSNSSFDADVVAIKRMINRDRSFQDVYDFYYDATQATYDPGEDRKGPKMSMFSPEGRRAFMAQFEQGNQYVAKKYFGRENGELFYERVEDVPQWEPDAERMLEAAVRVFSGADILLYKRIEELERKMTIMYNSLPARMYRKVRGIEEREDEA